MTAEHMARIRECIELAEHKIDQHLHGQYNHYPYPALGTALTSLRAALNYLNLAQGDKP